MSKQYYGSSEEACCDRYHSERCEDALRSDLQSKVLLIIDFDERELGKVLGEEFG